MTAEIDLGLKTVVTGEKLRLHRINAPEMRGPEKVAGKASRDYLRSRILGKEVIIETFKDKLGKHGRYIAEIWLPENDGYTNINERVRCAGPRGLQGVLRGRVAGPCDWAERPLPLQYKT